jgi:hypothetical protein
MIHRVMFCFVVWSQCFLIATIHLNVVRVSVHFTVSRCRGPCVGSWCFCPSKKEKCSERRAMYSVLGYCSCNPRHDSFFVVQPESEKKYSRFKHYFTHSQMQLNPLPWERKHDRVSVTDYVPFKKSTQLKFLDPLFLLFRCLDIQINYRRLIQGCQLWNWSG